MQHSLRWMPVAAEQMGNRRGQRNVGVRSLAAVHHQHLTVNGALHSPASSKGWHNRSWLRKPMSLYIWLACAVQMVVLVTTRATSHCPLDTASAAMRTPSGPNASAAENVQLCPETRPFLSVESPSLFGGHAVTLLRLTGEAEEVGHPVGAHGPAVSHDAIAVGLVHEGQAARFVVREVDADEHLRVGAPERRGVDTYTRDVSDSHRHSETQAHFAFRIA